MRAPRGPLQAFIERIWIGRSQPVCEHVIPTGTLHLALRLEGPAVRVDGAEVGHAVIGGPRSTYFVREVTGASCTVGAQLRPGAAYPLLGVTARVIADRHVALADVWANVEPLRARIAAAPTPAAALDVFEAALVARLGLVAACEIEPLVAHAARALDDGASVAEVVAEVGFSHRHVVRVFREHVGMTPKCYARVRRVVHAVVGEGGAWAQVAARAGFSDQAHLTREIHAITGVTPTELRKARGVGLHVPRSDSFKTG